jgi:hypothetical protein
MVQSGSIPDTARHNKQKESVTMQDNYKTIATKLANREPFRGNTMSAYWDERGNYRVLSYSTEIATSYAVGGSSMEIGRYSTTTSKHQGIIARVWFGDSITAMRRRNK